MIIKNIIFINQCSTIYKDDFNLKNILSKKFFEKKKKHEAVFRIFFF